MLLSRIRSIHQRSYGTYGAPRIHAELRASGIRAGRKRVARLMRMAAISGVSRRRAVRTTWRSEESKKAPDLVNRDFSAPVRDRLWVADITYVPTHAGFLYLSVVIDAFSRRVVGWSMANHLRSELVTDALDMALGMRKTPRGDPPQRPGIAVHLGGLRQKMQTGRGQTLNGFGRRLLRQRAVRELLRQPGMRTARSQALYHQGRRQTRPVPIHRGLLQHPEKTLFPWIPPTHELRKEVQENCLNPKP